MNISHVPPPIYTLVNIIPETNQLNTPLTWLPHVANQSYLLNNNNDALQQVKEEGNRDLSLVITSSWMEQVELKFYHPERLQRYDI